MADTERNRSSGREARIQVAAVAGAQAVSEKCVVAGRQHADPIAPLRSNPDKLLRRNATERDNGCGSGG
jgi:hypothetical protein